MVSACATLLAASPLAALQDVGSVEEISSQPGQRAAGPAGTAGLLPSVLDVLLPGNSEPPDLTLALPLLSLDCGDLNGYPAPEPGWTLLSESSAPVGVSLVPPPLDTVHVARFFPQAGIVAFPSSVVSLDPDQVDQRRLHTALQLASGTRLDLNGLPPDTRLRVRLELGALSPWMDWEGGGWVMKDSTSQGVVVEAWHPGAAAWEGLAGDLRCQTGTVSNTFTSGIASILRTWVLVTTDGTGRAQLRFSRENSGPVYLAAVRVHHHESLPIVYRRTAAGPLQAVAGQSASAAVTAFVEAFNAGDLPAARSAAFALPSPLARGTALLHLVGWLDGSRDGAPELLEPARQALELAVTTGHAAAVWLLDQLDAWERAEAHLAAGGRESAALCESQGGTGFLNPECAGQLAAPGGSSVANVNGHIALRELSGLVVARPGSTLLADLAAWNAGLIAEDRFEPSPLLWRAAALSAAIVPRMNPLLHFTPADPGGQALAELFTRTFAEFIDLGFAATDFPQELELRLFDAVAQAGTHPHSWLQADLEALFTDAELAASWWGSAVALPPENPAAPAWVNAQRPFLTLYERLVADWLLVQLQGTEFGGGQGDDVELLLQLQPLFMLRDDDRELVLRSRFGAVAQHGLEQHPLVAGGGYYNGALTDVAHAAEFVTNPFLATRAALGFPAFALRAALLNGRGLLSPANPAAAFAGTTHTGRTHMRSWWFTSEGPSDNPVWALDIFMNGRALAPAVALSSSGLLAAGHPLHADLRAWAAGWRDDALLSPAAAGGKPRGFPAPAAFPSNALGTAGLWYTETGTPESPLLWNSGSVSLVLGLMHSAWSQDATPTRWTWLAPAALMFRTIMDWELAGSPSGAAGSSNWVAALFKNSPRFAILALEFQQAFALTPELALQPHPTQAGVKLMDAALLARLREWAGSEALGHGLALTYMLGPVVSPCAPHSAKWQGNLTLPFAQPLAYYRAAWPLLTRHVLHTDRLLANPSNVLRELESMWTASAVIEGLPLRPAVRWAGNDLDLSVLTNHRSWTGEAWSAFVWVPGTSVRTATLVLEEGLRSGLWLAEWGVASATCDVLPQAPTGSLVVSKPGRTASVVMQLLPGLNLVRLVRQASVPAAAAHELALDPPHLLPAPSGSGQVVSVRIGNVGAAASPSRLLLVTLTPVDAQGQPQDFPGLVANQWLGESFVTVPGLSGWELPTVTREFAIAAGSPASAALQAGLGLRLEALIVGGTDSDPLNDRSRQIVFLHEQ